MHNDYQIRKAVISDLEEICTLQNHHILHTDDIYSEQLKSLEEIKDWLTDQMNHGFPVIVAEVNGSFAGFASYGLFRKRPCYASTVEHSVYLEAKYQGGGLGTALMEELFKIARANNLHAMMGGIDSKNTSSIQFHQRLGFKEVGRVPEVALKNGNWLELVLMQKIL